MKHLKAILILILLLAVSTSSMKAQGLSVGDRASDFTLPGVNGKQVSLSDYRNAKGVILVFTCNTCPYAQAYEARIMALDGAYAAKGYPVVAINPNNPDIQPGDSFDKMKQRAEAKAYSFPYLVDKGQKVFPAYGATRTPHVFLLEQKSGEFFVRYIGAIDDNYQDPAAVSTPYVEEAVDALLTGAPVPTATTRAIGCGIKA